MSSAPCSSAKSMTPTIPGCCKLERMRASRTNCALLFFVSFRCGSTRLITTGFEKPAAPSTRARYTAPMPPCASGRTMRYRPNTNDPISSSMLLVIGVCGAPNVNVRSPLGVRQPYSERPLVGGHLGLLAKPLLTIQSRRFAVDFDVPTRLGNPRDRHLLTLLDIQANRRLQARRGRCVVELDLHRGLARDLTAAFEVERVRTFWQRSRPKRIRRGRHFVTTVTGCRAVRQHEARARRCLR